MMKYVVSVFAVVLLTSTAVSGKERQLVEIGISPNLPPQYVRWGLEAALDIVKHSICSEGDVAIFTNSLTLERVSEVELSSRFTGKTCTDKMSQWKGQLYRGELTRLANFFKGQMKNDAEAIGELGIPDYLNLVASRAAQYPARDYRRDVLLIGSPVHIDPLGEGFSCLESWPSDGHLRTSWSPFRVVGRENTLSGLSVHVVHPPKAFYNDVHRQRLARFWSLFLGPFGLGGKLVTFTEDNLVSDRVGLHLTAIPSEYNPADSKPEMYSARRRDAELWADLPESTPPATDSTGPLVIGIRWHNSCRDCDLDLYGGFRDGGIELSYKRAAAPWGVHIKDYVRGGASYETIAFHRSINIRDVQARVNFFAGQSRAPVRGELRIKFAGQIYGATFSMEARSGNRGRTGRGQERYWTTLPLLEIVGLD